MYQNFEAFIIDRRQTPIAFPAFYFQQMRFKHFDFECRLTQVIPVAGRYKVLTTDQNNN